MKPPLISQDDNVITIVIRLETSGAVPPQRPAGQPSADDLIMTVPQVAKYLQISKTKVYYLIQRREIPFIQLGEGNVRIRKSELEKWLAEQTQPEQK